MARTWKAFALTGWMAVAFAPGTAWAQYPMAQMGAPATGGMDLPSPTRGMGALNANPMANPYLNPFLNPYAAQTMSPNGVTPGQAALYFVAAQQANGGIGSGRLSGTRPDPRAAAPTRASSGARPAAPEPRRVDANTPGATASRFFNRSFEEQTGAERYYNRQNGQFPSNRRGR